MNGDAGDGFPVQSSEMGPVTRDERFASQANSGSEHGPVSLLARGFFLLPLERELGFAFIELPRASRCRSRPAASPTPEEQAFRRGLGDKDVLRSCAACRSNSPALICQKYVCIF